MEADRLEALCFVYAGAVLSVAGVVLAYTQSDPSWLLIYSTGPLLVVFGLYRLRQPGGVDRSHDGLGPRVYSLLAFDAFVTLVVAFQFVAHLG